MPKRWKKRARLALTSAKALYLTENWPGCANRAYYAAYQVCTAVCLEHGDAVHFPPDWNNPTHEQLPDLITNNGDLTLLARRTITAHLNFLREARVDADYRPGRAILSVTALSCLQRATQVFALLEIKESENAT